MAKRELLDEEQMQNLSQLVVEDGFPALMRVIEHLVLQQGERVLKYSLAGSEASANELLFAKSRYDGAQQLRTDLVQWLSTLKKSQNGQPD